ncbi:MAG: hypothetical protein B7C24_16635 [Bacteroidetes bacterium 4572_77]|nr:MAG: hypothetical protein B7C24_16635 [Bacteroidetes bacterium 4572_77]
MRVFFTKNYWWNLKEENTKYLPNTLAPMGATIPNARVEWICCPPEKPTLLTMKEAKNYGFVIPDDPKIPVDFFISKDNFLGAKDGQKVITQLEEWPEQARNPFGKIVQVLGNPGDHKVEIESIIYDYDFESRFPSQVEAEADKINNDISTAEIKKRKDMREVFTITIDPFDAKDFDDAISLRKLKNGKWEVGIHIADVSYFVTPGSAIEAEAYKRATSIYLVDRVIPMLPEKLSNNVCSLRPHEEKLAFSAIFEMDDEAKISKEWFGRTVIKSDHRYAYEDAQEIIEGKEGPFAPEILQFHELAQKLRSERFSKGSIRFHSVEVKFKLDEESNPIGVYVKLAIPTETPILLYTVFTMSPIRKS